MCVRPIWVNKIINFLARVEEIFLEVVERMQTRIEQLEREQRVAAAPVNPNPIQNEQQMMHGNKLRLEPMKLEIFSGNYRQWSEWHSLFDTLIHNNERQRKHSIT